MAVTKELKEAVIAMQAGNTEGFAKVYEETHDYVYAKARYIMKLEQDALDLTQETYIQAYKGIASLEDVNNVYAWLGGVVYRQGMKIFNKKKEILTDEEQDYIFDSVVSNEATPEQVAEQKATVEIVRGMIDELPELQRVAVMAFYYDNMKIDAIADMCECSANTIKSRLNYAKKFLKTKVEEHEKQNRYKLCSVSPAILLLVFKGMFGEAEYKMSAQAVQNVYTASCNSLGIQMVSSATSKMALGEATKVAGNFAGGIVKTSIVTKVGITIVALAITGGIGTAIINHMNNKPVEEPVVAVEQQEDSEYEEEQTEVTTENTEEVEALYDESIPMEGLYQYGAYTISITNATVTDYKNATFDMELTYTSLETGEVETVLATSVKKENGVADIDATSSLENRWFGSLMFLYDGSIRLNLSKQDTNGDVWDIMWGGSVVILTKAGAEGLIQDRMPEEGTYSYTDGTEAATDGGYILTISNVDTNSFQMKFEIIYDGGNRIDGIITDGDWVFMNNGIATFTGASYWDAGMQGYLYVNEDGSITLSYSTTYGTNEDGSIKPIILKK